MGYSSSSDYIDHGVKKLTSITLVAKRASIVAFVLLTIFTEPEQGPPSILQTDNGGKFSGHVYNHVGCMIVLEDEFIDLAIKELKNLWPECQMVRSLPRHSESNECFERVNHSWGSTSLLPGTRLITLSIWYRKVSTG